VVFAHYPATSRSVYCVGFDPSGKKLVSGSADKTVRIWDVTTGESIGSPLTGHTDWVTQVEFIDADTVVSSSDDGTTRAWDVATGTQKAEFEGDKFSFTKSSGGDEQTVGAYVVTKKDNLVLVHQTHALTHNEPTAENNHAVAFFRAPGVVQTLECAGDRIAVGCQNGEVLHLQAAWLVDS
jgi:WD40 repeat protein